MRVKATLGALALATMSLANSAASQFTDDEKSRIMAFWAEPGRYKCCLPKDADAKGVWQVRLTTAGSMWFWNYIKGKKTFVPPTENPTPVTNDQKLWEAWLNTKLNRDRWEALQKAREANQRILGKELPKADRTIPSQEPPLPGPIPPGLVAAAGNPPCFAEIVSPMEHAVSMGDLDLVFQDNVRVSSPRYAFYRFPQGVMCEGVHVKTMPPERLGHLYRLAGVTNSEANVMRAVSVLEGGFDSINTYDTGFVSVGFIQFATLQAGGGSLGAMLKQYKFDNPDQFNLDFRRFGIDVTEDGLMDILDPSTGAEVVGPDANKRLIEDKRLIAVFQRAGLKSDPYKAAQIKSAKLQFFPSGDEVVINLGDKTLSGQVSTFIHSEAGMATLMDRKVNTGKLDPLVSVVTRVAKDHEVGSLEELAKYEREIIQGMKYRKDYLSDATLSQPGVMSFRATTKSLADRSGGTRGHRKTKKSGG